jgi:hypothetical protein
MAPFERFAIITAAALTLSAAALAPAGAAVRSVVDAYTATTTGMMPADLVLRIQVLEWSDDSAQRFKTIVCKSGNIHFGQFIILLKFRNFIARNFSKYHSDRIVAFHLSDFDGV